MRLGQGRDKIKTAAQVFGQPFLRILSLIYKI